MSRGGWIVGNNLNLGNKEKVKTKSDKWENNYNMDCPINMVEGPGLPH